MRQGRRNYCGWASLAWLTLLATSLPFCTGAMAQDEPAFRVQVGDAEVACDPPPLSDGDEVLLPGPLLAAQLGLRVIPPTAPSGQWEVQFYGNRLSLRLGATAARLNGQQIELKAKPRAVGQTLFFPVSALFDCFGIAYDISRTGAQVTCRLTPPAGRIASVRHHTHADRVRVAVDLEEPAAFTWTLEADRFELRVRAPEIGPAPLAHWETIADPIVRTVRSEAREHVGVVTVETVGAPKCEVFTLGGPPRIVVDLLRPKPRPADLASRIARSVQFHRRTVPTSRGPVIVNMATVDLTVPGIGIRPALAGDTIAHRARTSSISAREGAVAGVNGGYFAPRGQPLGLLVIDGEWITHPILGRTCLGITADGKVLMDRLAFAGSLTAPGAGTVALDGLNCGHQNPNEAIAYSARWGERLQGHPRAVRVVLAADGTVLLVEKWQRDVNIPPGGWVISATGTKAKQLESTQRGGKAKIELKTDPEWRNLRHAIGGGPRLVKDGKLHITSGPEQFRSDVTAGLAPRTAVGIRADGKILLVTVDGRQPGVSEGVTLRELAELMIRLGARDAMALDGGGSTTFWLKGQVMNRPCDGVERTVSNALLVVPETPGA